MRDLSVLIPARNERWLQRTVEDVLSHIEADTEVIVALDGAWAEPALPQHERLTVLRVPESIGQRAAVNLAAKLSTARYVMKLDGHCSVAQGFDRVLIEAAKTLGENVTQIPAQKNLHVYDRVCQVCQKRNYQGPPDKVCDDCGGVCDLEVVWKPRSGSTTANWIFDSEPHFQYGPRLKTKEPIRDVMTSLGACFFMRRERFWELGGLDEAHGSWGSFGIEIACKSWLSGGRHVVNTQTWFAHFFRVGGIGFPYEIHGSDQQKAREYARDLWFTNRWPGQVRPLKWLVEKFWPVEGWTEAQRDALPPLKRARTKGIVYYSDNLPTAHILNAARRTIAESGLPIVAVTIGQPSGTWPMRVHEIALSLERGPLTMFRQILTGLEALDTDDVFLCEHDVLYHPSHFSFAPQSHLCYFYNVHTYKVDATTGHAVTYETKQTSGLCADRQLLIAHYRERIRRVESEGFSRKMGFEPGSHRRTERVDDVPSDTWRSEYPNLDIRHSKNLTQTRWSPSEFRDQRQCRGWQETDTVPGWGRTEGRMRELFDTVARREVAA